MLLKEYTKVNIWCDLGITLILSIAGFLLTNAIAYNCSILEALMNDYQWIDTLSILACASLCFIVTFIRKAHPKNNYIKAINGLT